MSTDLATWQRYRLDMECGCGATFFGLVEAGDQWHADHMNEHCTRETPHRLVRNVMLPPEDADDIENWDDVFDPATDLSGFGPGCFSNLRRDDR